MEFQVTLGLTKLVGEVCFLTFPVFSQLLCKFLICPAKTVQCVVYLSVFEVSPTKTREVAGHELGWSCVFPSISCVLLAPL